MKLSELFTDESKWVKRMFRGYRPSPTCAPCFMELGDERANCFCLGEGITFVFPFPSQGPDVLFEDRESFRRLVRVAIGKLFPGRSESHGIFRFNDHPDTTFADVQAVIREVELTQ